MGREKKVLKRITSNECDHIWEKDLVVESTIKDDNKHGGHSLVSVSKLLPGARAMAL